MASQSDCVTQETPKSCAIVTPPSLSWPANYRAEDKVLHCLAGSFSLDRRTTKSGETKVALPVSSHSLSVLFVAFNQQHSKI